MNRSSNDILIRSIKHSLKILSPIPRYQIIALIELIKGPKKLSELVRECKSLGFECGLFESSVRRLAKDNVVVIENGVVGLTDCGLEISQALNDVINELKNLVSKVRGKSIDYYEVLTQAFTPVASLVALTSDRSKEVKMFELAIHGFISILIATVFCYLSAENPELIDILRTLELAT